MRREARYFNLLRCPFRPRPAPRGNRPLRRRTHRRARASPASRKRAATRIFREAGRVQPAKLPFLPLHHQPGAGTRPRLVLETRAPRGRAAPLGCPGHRQPVREPGREAPQSPGHAGSPPAPPRCRHHVIRQHRRLPVVLFLVRKCTKPGGFQVSGLREGFFADDAALLPDRSPGDGHVRIGRHADDQPKGGRARQSADGSMNEGLGFHVSR